MRWKMTCENYFHFVIFSILFNAISSFGKEIPDFIHVCNVNDPKIEECFINSTYFIKPKLVEGIPEYNIPSLEPLVIDELVASESNGGGLKITANNVKAYGASDFYIQNLKLDLSTHRYDFDVDLPHLYIEASYAIDGRILLIPIRGQGPMTGNFTDCIGRVLMQGEYYEKEGETYIRYKSLTIKIKIGNGRIHLDNLFGGEKTLGEVVNGAINSNFDAFAHELLPVIEKALGRVFLNAANSIVEPFTYEQLFPTD